MACRGHCTIEPIRTKFKSKERVHKPFQNGYVICRPCQIYMLPLQISCPCCNRKFSRGPKSKYDKERFHDNQQSLKVIVV